MSAHEIEKIVCRRCHALLDVGDRYCRHCGTPTSAAMAGPPADRPRWSDSPWTVLIMLFLVLGPLALPMLWRSRQFSVFWKVVLTAIVAALTVLIFVLLWYVIHKALEPLQELRSLRRF